MNIVNIQPVSILNQTATQLGAYVINYDLNAQNCTLFWKLMTSEGNSIYSGNYSVPHEVLAVWGADDALLMQSLADSNGFIIIS